MEGYKLKQAGLLLRFIIILSLVALLSLACTAAPPKPPPAPPVPVNQKPEILYVATPQQVEPSGTAEIKCIATDPDKDPLTYTWTADAGTINGTGDTVTWKAPDKAGMYNITVRVSDGKGGEAVNSGTNITITAKPNRSPIVNSFTVTNEKAPPITFTLGMKSINVKRHSLTTVECNAVDPDGDVITYAWSVTAGKVVGDGKKVEYYSAEAGDIAITVTITDSRGAFTKSSVYFNIPCCGQT
jgi:hypothetical protein